MQRIIFATLLGLTMAIGLTVGAVAWRTTSIDRTLPDVGTADPAIGYAFYDGIEKILADGDATALEQAVTDDFVDHASDRSVDRSTEELVHELTAFGASFPGTQFQVTEIQASSSSLVASVSPIKPEPVEVAGMTLTAQSMNGGFEVLRIRNGKVSERWSSGLPEFSAATFDSIEFSPNSTMNVTSRLNRVALPRGTELVLWGERSSLVIAEQGTVRISIEALDSAGLMHEDKLTLQQGEAVRTVPATTLRLESDGDETAQALIFSTRPVTAMDVPPRMHTEGANISLLWASNLPVTPHGPWSLSVGKVVVPAKSEVTLSTVADAEVLFCSEDGTVQVTAAGGSIASLDEKFVASEQGDSGTVEAGVAANITGATQISFRSTADAPTTIWLITIVPVASPGTAVP